MAVSDRIMPVQPQTRCPSGHRGMFVVALSAVLAIIFLLSLAMWERMSSELTQTDFILEGEIATYLAESAASEAVAHLIETSNRPGSPWFREFRKRAGTLVLNPVRDKPFTPQTANQIFRETYGRKKKYCRSEVLISFTGVRQFDKDPAPDPLEKRVQLHIQAESVFGRARKKLVIIKDVKVIRVAPPEPLARYTLWLRDRGCLPDKGSLDLARIESLNRHTEAKNIIEKQWSYTIKRNQNVNTMSGYPLCKQKVSRFFSRLPDFEETFKNSRTSTYHLDGLSVLMSDSPIRLSGAAKGSGILFTPFSSFSVNGLNIPDSSIMTLVSGKSDIKLQGYPDTHSAHLHLMAPHGTVYTEATTSIAGTVYARDWNLTGSNRLAPTQEDLARKTYYVSIGEQTNSWKVVTEQ